MQYQFDERYVQGGREVVIVDALEVACDGGPVAALGHPREFITLIDDGKAHCKYCSRLFVHVDHPDVPLIRKRGDSPGA